MKLKEFLLTLVCICFSVSAGAQKVPWTPERMTPLVGKHCVINQIDKDLIDVVGIESSLGNVVDTNIDNYASLSKLAGINVAYFPVLSVKDVVNMYPAGIETGFVLQSENEGNNLLTADVLKMFVVETYLDGEKQESSVSDNEHSGLLDLNLITIAADGKTKLSIRATKPFDEVRLAVAGVNVEAFKQLRLYYAYVGENKMKPITRTEYYPEASVHSHKTNGIGDAWTTSVWNWPQQKEYLVGVDSETDGIGFGLLSDLLTEPRVTVDAGEEIPANTEVGFVIERGSVLAIDLLKNTVITTYDAEDKEVESKKIVSALGLGLATGGKTTVSMITTKPCRQVKIQFGGLNVNLGGTKLYHAYTRDANVYVEEACDLGLSADIVVCSRYSVQLRGVAGIKWSIEDQPEGASASVDADGLVTGMILPGEYVIKAEKDGCTDFVTINNSPESNISSECNRPIVGENVEHFAPHGGGCLLCISPDLDDNSRNVVDTDLTNYIEYTKGLDLLSNTSIYGVKRTDGVRYDASEENPIRVGFVMEATDQFLNADLLKFFVIKTYLGEEEVEASPADENDAVQANLIGGTGNMMRYSFVATRPFDRVAIWTAGVLSLHLSKIRIYYAFEEPANSGCFDMYSSTSCLSLLSSANGAGINYDRTGFGGVANVGAVMHNLSNLLDGDMNTYAYINKTAGVAANTTLSIKSDQVFEPGYQAGFVIEENTWVGNVDLLRFCKVRTYLDGVETGDESLKPEVLSLDLIGSFGKSLVAIHPTKPFDEIVLDMSGLLDALVELKVYGAFVQPDTDGDGIPDCMDKNPCGEEMVVDVETVMACVGTDVVVRLTGGKDNLNYILNMDGSSYPFIDGVATVPTAKSGQFICSISDGKKEVYTNLPINVHPSLTTWTGAVSADWNDWDNWTDGVPSHCTNVVIPSVEELVKTNGINYPVLKEGGMYCCDGIHFKPGAEVVGQDLLVYQNAWVSVNVIPDMTYMVSVPLTDTYPCDYYIPVQALSTGGKDLRNPFNETISGDVDRLNPYTVWNGWNGEYWNAIEQSSDIGKEQHDGKAIAITLLPNDKISGESVVEMLLGKADTSYQGVDMNGNPSGAPLTLTRDNPNQFIFPHDKGSAIKDFQSRISLPSASQVFVVSNPFMCHLDVDAFLVKNPDVKYVRVNDNMLDNPYSDYDGELLTTYTAGSGGRIRPTQVFFAELQTPTDMATFNFGRDMMTTGDYSVLVRKSAPKPHSAKKSEGKTIGLPTDISVTVINGEAVITSAERIDNVRVTDITGHVIAVRTPDTTDYRVRLVKGVNIITVKTASETRTFKVVM